jgi:RNA polymerase II subunit A small phosphatase-like protein
LERTLIIDDIADKSMLKYGNAIQITEFTGNADDDELLLLASYLKKFKNVENVRQMDKRFLTTLVTVVFLITVPIVGS